MMYDPSFIDDLYNWASQSMMDYSMRSRGGVAVVLFFFPFLLFLFLFFLLFIHSSVDGLSILEESQQAGWLLTTSLPCLALPASIRNVPYIRVTRKCIHMCNVNEVHAWYKRVTYIYIESLRELHAKLKCSRICTGCVISPLRMYRNYKIIKLISDLIMMCLRTRNRFF